MIIRVFLVFLLLFFWGCVSIPKEDLQGKVAIAPSLLPSQEEALASTTFSKGEWPAADWWVRFGDAQLDAFERVALEESPSLKKTFSRIRRAQEMAKEKRSSLYPQIWAGAEDNWQRFSDTGLWRTFAPTVPPVINQIDLTLDFRYEFDFWGKNSHIFKAALGEMHSAEAEAAQAKIMVTTAVAKTYVALQADGIKLKIAKEMEKQRSSLYQLTASRQAHGIDTEVETLQAEQTLLAAKQFVQVLEEAVENDVHLLKVLIGRGPDDQIPISPPHGIFNEPFPLPEQIAVDLLARRPDLMAAIWRTEAAAHEISAAKTHFYPNVDLTAIAGLDSLSFKKFLLIKSFASSLRPAIHLPIFTGGKLKAQLGTKVAIFQEAVYEYNELLLKAAQEVADQITTLRSVSEQLRLQKIALERARQQYTLKFFRFTQGVSNYLYVLEAEEELLQLRFATAQLEFFRFAAAVNLIKSLGGGYLAP